MGRVSGFFIAIVVGGVRLAHACQICVPFPTRSVADHLIECDTVLLAREDPKRPFHFRSVKVLKGAVEEREIDLFLDSMTRRILKAYPGRSVLLARGKDQAWRRLAMVDAQFQVVIRQVLEMAPGWQRAAKRGRPRVEYFAKHLGHANAQISQLAHLEVGRAPYSEIKRLGSILPREKIHAFLADRRYVEWQALYILLLAQSKDPRDRQLVLDSMRSAERFGSTLQLAAWATAFIEVEGTKAIDYLESRYFRDARRRAEELREVLRALSVQGTSGQTRLRDRIAASYKVLLQLHPAMAPRVVDDLFAWRRWELAGCIRRVALEYPKSFEPDAARKLHWFVAMASQATATPSAK